MPNRILRDGIISSERVDRLSGWAQEVFYRRLISVVDDYGRYYANPSLLRAACYPLKLDKVSNADVGKWLSDCENAGLVSTYEVDGKRYLQLLDFRQQVRAKESKYPQVPSTCIALATHPPASAHLDGDGVVVEDDRKTLSGTPDASPPAAEPSKPNPKAEAREILEFLNAKVGRAYEPVDANLELIVARLREGATAAKCRQVIVKKSREWAGDEKMSEYLRPATLFNRTKFAQYVGELVANG